MGNIVILDIYSDEPSGLGVPPYLGVHPRYAFGVANKVISSNNSADDLFYLTIDDLRTAISYLDDSLGLAFTEFVEKLPRLVKTDISRHNFSKNLLNVFDIFKNASKVLFVGGVNTPGKYLRAKPPEIKELLRLLDKEFLLTRENKFKKKKVDKREHTLFDLVGDGVKLGLYGPIASVGSSSRGGYISVDSVTEKFYSYFDIRVPDDYEMTLVDFFEDFKGDFSGKSIDKPSGDPSEDVDKTSFKKFSLKPTSYEKLEDFVKFSYDIVDQISFSPIIEIETGKGCMRSSHCSYCTEPLKHPNVFFRSKDAIYEEIRGFVEKNVHFVRLGKQSCFYSYMGSNFKKIDSLLSSINEDFGLYNDPEFQKKKFSDISEIPKGLVMFHIDNVNPQMVVSENGRKITESIVRNCSPGNVAAMGIESFDDEVVKQNNLNSDYETTMEAIKIINEYGAKKGYDGQRMFLPGINLLLGLKGETKKTLDLNYKALKKIYDDGLMVRRINIRDVSLFEGTELHSYYHNNFSKKKINSLLSKRKGKYEHFKFKVRHDIDIPFLKMVFDKGSVLKNIFLEIHDGNNTFGRSFSTYPIVCGIKERLPLKIFEDVVVTGYMKRSLVCSLHSTS